MSFFIVNSFKTNDARGTMSDSAVYIPNISISATCGMRWCAAKTSVVLTVPFSALLHTQFLSSTESVAAVSPDSSDLPLVATPPFIQSSSTVSMVMMLLL